MKFLIQALFLVLFLIHPSFSLPKYLSSQSFSKIDSSFLTKEKYKKRNINPEEFLKKKKSKAIKNIQKEWHLTYDDLKVVENKIKLLKKQEKNRKDRKVIFDKNLKINSNLKDFIKNQFLNIAYGDLYVSYKPSINEAFTDIETSNNRCIKKLYLGKKFSSFSFEEQKTILLHELIHLRKYHPALGNELFIAAQKKESKSIPSRTRNKRRKRLKLTADSFFASKSCLALYRTHEAEADILSALHDKEIISGQIALFKKYVKYDKKQKTQHPLFSKRLARAEKLLATL